MDNQLSISLAVQVHNAAGETVPMVLIERPSKLTPYLKPGDGVLDLGANIGGTARMFAARVGPTGAVVAVEADPATAMLCRMCAADLPQVRVLPVAVAEEASVRHLHLDANNSRRHSLYRANLTTDSAHTTLVPTLPLDTLADSVPNLAAIKVDLQGAEGAMLDGGSATLGRHRLTWCVELWPLGLAQACHSIEAVVGTFGAYGWRPVGTTWAAVLERANAKPHGVQDVVLQHG